MGYARPAMDPARRRRVVVVDDHQVSRVAAKAMLQAVDSLEWVGEAASGRHAIALVSELNPDIVILDVEMPDFDGPATAAALLKAAPHLLILGWTVSEDSASLLRMLNAGCAGYLLKESGPSEFAQAVETAVRGDLPVPRRLMAEIVWEAARRAGTAPKPNNVPRLTPAEDRVLRQLGQGDPLKVIAHRLSIAPSSVDSHLRSIYRKLGAANRAQAVANAIRAGIVSADDFVD